MSLEHLKSLSHVFKVVARQTDKEILGLLNYKIGKGLLRFNEAESSLYYFKTAYNDIIQQSNKSSKTVAYLASCAIEIIKITSKRVNYHARSYDRSDYQSIEAEWRFYTKKLSKHARFLQTKSKRSKAFAAYIYLQLAECGYGDRNNEVSSLNRSIELLEELIKDGSQNCKLVYATALEKKGKFQQRIEEFNSSINTLLTAKIQLDSISKKNTQVNFQRNLVHHYLGRAELETGNFRVAANHFEMALDNIFDLPEKPLYIVAEQLTLTSLHYASLWSKIGQLDRAEDILYDALKLYREFDIPETKTNFNTLDLYCELAQIAEKQGQFEMMKTLYERAHVIANNNRKQADSIYSEIVVGLSFSSMKLGKRNDAVEYIKIAANVSSYRCLGSIATKLNAVASSLVKDNTLRLSALNLANRMYARDFKNREKYYLAYLNNLFQLGDCHILKGNSDGAKQLYRLEFEVAEKYSKITKQEIILAQAKICIKLAETYDAAKDYKIIINWLARGLKFMIQKEASKERVDSYLEFLNVFCDDRDLDFVETIQKVFEQVYGNSGTAMLLDFIDIQ